MIKQPKYDERIITVSSRKNAGCKQTLIWYNGSVMLTKDDLKALVDTISPLIDARAKTTETLLTGEIKASEERTKEELRAEILASQAEAKADHLMLRSEVIKKINHLEKRTEAIEKEASIPNPRNINPIPTTEIINCAKHIVR